MAEIILTPEEKKIVRRIRTMVKKTHWTKQHFHTRKKGKDMYCLVGFVNKETGVDVGRMPGVHSVTEWSSDYTTHKRVPEPKERKHILMALNESVRIQSGWKKKGSIVKFNDRLKTTREDIIAVLDRVLEK